MSSSDEGGSPSASSKKYRGIRRRKWGKWVSEIRVPGTLERLWLGSYSNPEAAAVAHDVASYCLKGPSSAEKLNFPQTLPAGLRAGMSPRSVQKVASDAGLAVDAQFAVMQSTDSRDVGVSSANIVSHGVDCAKLPNGDEGSGSGDGLNISVDDYL